MNYLMLVNDENRLPADYEPQALTTLEGTNLSGDPRAVRALSRMLDAATIRGLSLLPVSGYRSYGRQAALYRGESRPYAVAPPGASEHQTGLAFDIASAAHPQLEQSFEQTPEYRWLLENAPDYGFILRYPRGAESETGVIFEPWHYRYVGPVAPAVAASGKTLEGFKAAL